MSPLKPPWPASPPSDNAPFGESGPRHNLVPLQALLDAAQTSEAVRRAIGFSWFSPTTTDPKALDLIDRISSLAIYVEG